MLQGARITSADFHTFTELWRKVHQLHVATDLTYNSIGRFSRKEMKVRRCRRAGVCWGRTCCPRHDWGVSSCCGCRQAGRVRTGCVASEYLRSWSPSRPISNACRFVCNGMWL